MKRYSKFIIALLILNIKLLPQVQDSVITITAGENYNAGWFRSIIAGKLWRDLWTEPFEVKVLDLGKYAGGLTPAKIGGGMQTRSLHFIGGDGRRYKFRSMDKDPSRSLPPELRESFIADELQDQVPVQNPVSSVITAPLMNSVGIINAPPEIFLMPDDYRLGEFREEFRNMPGTIEENPDDYAEDELNFAGSDKVVSTYKLFEKLEKDNDETVDAAEFLKARLFDIFIGDRDRHAGQWKWAGYQLGNQRVWRPIPKDRDFAFPLYDGLVPLAMRIAMTSIVHFDYDMPSMFDMTWEGRHLDRRFLSSLTKSEWDSVAAFMIGKLTDEVIMTAVRKMPEELFKLRGTELINKLISRRDQLKEASDEFYLLANMYVDIYCSDKKEYVEIQRNDNNSTTVTIYKLKEESADLKGRLLFGKTFDHSITKEVRIHLLDGDDRAIVRGEVENGIRVIVDGGDGADRLIDSSLVKNDLLGFIPLKVVTTATEFYDSGKKSDFFKGSSTKIVTRKYPEAESTELKYEPVVEDRYRDFTVDIPFEINPDDGTVLGFGGIFNFYDFRMTPYSFRLAFAGSYATESREFEFIADGKFNKLVDGIQVHLYTQYTGTEVSRFFGYGNNTLFSDILEDEGFYDINQRYFFARTLFNFEVNSGTTFSIGLSYETSELKNTTDRLIGSVSLTGKGTLRSASFIAGFKYDTRDNENFTYEGNSIEMSLIQSPSFLNFDNTFGKLIVEGRHFVTTEMISKETLALKLTGEYVWGNYPFFRAATVGGRHSLRGLPRYRFNGDASISLQTDIRIFIGKINLFVPGEFGFTLVNDAGRVFLDSEESGRWHSAHGGGLWFNVLDRIITLSLNLVRSKEDTRFYLTFGHSF